MSDRRSDRQSGIGVVMAFVPLWAWGPIVAVALCIVVLLGAVFPSEAESS